LIFDLEAEQDTDHVVAIFKVRGHWGAVAKSNFTGCRYREPVYRTLRELAMSYFNIYFNLRGERTLRRYSRPVNLARFDDLNWMATEKPIWFIAEHLCEIPHVSLLTAAMEKNLTRLDRRTMSARWSVTERRIRDCRGRRVACNWSELTHFACPIRALVCCGPADKKGRHAFVLSGAPSGETPK